MKVWKGVQDRNTLHSAPDVKLTIYDSNKLLVGEKKNVDCSKILSSEYPPSTLI